MAPAPWTVPSHASIFTGLYPSFHGAHESSRVRIPDVRLRRDRLLLTYRLKELGYSTYLISANPSVSPYFGFRGFDYNFQVRSFSHILSHNEILSLRRLRKALGGGPKFMLVPYLIRMGRLDLLLRAGVYQLKVPLCI